MEYILRFNVRHTRGAEFVEWLTAQTSRHEPLRNGHNVYPAWTYVGTWLDVMSLGRYNYETRWTLEDRVSVSKRPLSPEAERNPAACLEFIDAGEVAVLNDLRGMHRA